MRVIEDIWFSGFTSTVGIVIGEDDITGERKAYIGSVVGIDRMRDIQYLSDYGAVLFPEIATRIAQLLNPSNEKI